MKMNQQIILRAFFGLSVAGLFNGCTIPRDNMSTSTTEYNLVVEKAQNEMLLLNIVRASKRRPMYFTSFSKLTGSMSYEFQTGGINIPFGKIGTGLNGSYSIAPSIRYSNNPLFDLAVQDSKEFTQGIMTPVPMSIIEYYYKQGWPTYLLLHLFIERIEIKEDGKLKPINNDPEDPNFNEFQKLIQTKKWEIVDVNHVDVNLPINPIGEINDTEASKLETLVEAQKAGLKISSIKKGNKKQVFQIEYVFKGTDPKDPSKAPMILTTERESSHMAYRRSPEAILYYLGEILRVENRKKDPKDPKTYPYTPMIKNVHCSKHPASKLFYARIGTVKDTAPVSVDYEGDKYIIPQDPDYNDGCCADRSMSVLTLVSQLIGLQREIKEAPTTGVVSVIGR